MNAPEARSPEHPDKAQAYVSPRDLPPTLQALLAHIVAEYAPELEATLEAFSRWMDRHPEAEPGAYVSPSGEDQPSFGPISYRLQGETVDMMSAGHSVWTLQRVLDAYSVLPEEERALARRIFEDAGGERLLDLRPVRRLMRKDNRLAFA
jgi:hypothetical protein